MKLVLVLLFCVVSIWCSPRFKRQMFGDVNLKSIPGIMKNAEAVRVHCECLMATPERARIRCDRMGNRLRDQFPKLVDKGDCPTGCTTEEKKTSALIVQTLRDKYPECWLNAVIHYNITTEKLKALETFIEAANKLT